VSKSIFIIFSFVAHLFSVTDGITDTSFQEQFAECPNMSGILLTSFILILLILLYLMYDSVEFLHCCQSDSYKF